MWMQDDLSRRLRERIARRQNAAEEAKVVDAYQQQYVFRFVCVHLYSFD